MPTVNQKVVDCSPDQLLSSSVTFCFCTETMYYPQGLAQGRYNLEFPSWYEVPSSCLFVFSDPHNSPERQEYLFSFMRDDHETRGQRNLPGVSKLELVTPLLKTLHGLYYDQNKIQGKSSPGPTRFSMTLLTSPSITAPCALYPTSHPATLALVHAWSALRESHASLLQGQGPPRGLPSCPSLPLLQQLVPILPLPLFPSGHVLGPLLPTLYPFCNLCKHSVILTHSSHPLVINCSSVSLTSAFQSSCQLLPAPGHFLPTCHYNHTLNNTLTSLALLFFPHVPPSFQINLAPPPPCLPCSAGWGWRETHRLRPWACLPPCL